MENTLIQQCNSLNPATDNKEELRFKVILYFQLEKINELLGRSVFSSSNGNSRNKS
jgi:hypothetical protein